MWYRTRIFRPYYNPNSHLRWSNPGRRWVPHKTFFAIAVGIALFIPVSYRLQLLLAREGEPFLADEATVSFMEFLRLNALSRWWGAVASAPCLPSWAHRKMIVLFSWYFGVPQAEWNAPENYRTMQEFYVREEPSTERRFPSRSSSDSRPEKQPDALTLRAPCSGIITQLGEVDGGALVQVKGCTYRLDNLLCTKDVPMCARKGGQGLLSSGNGTNRKRLFFAFHLRGRDSKHFYCPVEHWLLHETTHASGALFPVASRGMCRYIPHLFTANERVSIIGRSTCSSASCAACHGSLSTEQQRALKKRTHKMKAADAWDSGLVAMSCVGGLCVGKIRLDFDERVETNSPHPLEFAFRRSYLRAPDSLVDASAPSGGSPLLRPTCCTLSEGERVGHFDFGSAIVLVADVPKDLQFAVRVGDVVTAGVPLVSK